MGKLKREALRLAIYIRMLGKSPVVSETNDWGVRATELRKQYESARGSTEAEKGRQGRIAGRGLIRKYGLVGAAQILLPEIFRNVSACDDLPFADRCRPDSKRYTSKETWNCRRKLKHVDLLSALRHAEALGDPEMVVYACMICGALHVGHHPLRAKIDKITSKLRMIAEDLSLLNRRRAELINRRYMLLAREIELQSLLRLETDEEDFSEG